MVKITIERIETVWEKQRNWNILHSDPLQPNQFGYVDAELPVKRTTLLLEQNLPDGQFGQSRMWEILKVLNRPKKLMTPSSASCQDAQSAEGSGKA